MDVWNASERLLGISFDSYTISLLNWMIFMIGIICYT